jgi:hypothetical protein
MERPSQPPPRLTANIRAARTQRSGKSGRNGPQPTSGPCAIAPGRSSLSTSVQRHLDCGDRAPAAGKHCCRPPGRNHATQRSQELLRVADKPAKWIRRCSSFRWMQKWLGVAKLTGLGGAEGSPDILIGSARTVHETPSGFAVVARTEGVVPQVASGGPTGTRIRRRSAG